MNLGMPYQNLIIMDACLEFGCHYLDTAAYEPEDVNEPVWRERYEKRVKEKGFTAYFDYSYQWEYKKKFEEKVNMKFVYYYMYKIDEWCKQHVNQGGFASVDMGGLYNHYFPLLSLEEQRRIVSILDTFEASITNLESQLKAREQQYEYYRNKLLTFE